MEDYASSGHDMKRLTLRGVNEEIKCRGGKETLVYSRAHGPYFYFINCGACGVPSKSIPISHLNAYSLEQWLLELSIARKEANLGE